VELNRGRVGTPSSRSDEDAGAVLTRCYHAGNWLLLALFALALASAGMSVRLFIVPCDKKTSYETTNTTTIVNLTSYFNQTVLENVTVTETVLQLENVTTRENVTREISYNVLSVHKSNCRGASRLTG
jgi:hypothetical protein